MLNSKTKIAAPFGFIIVVFFSSCVHWQDVTISKMEQARVIKMDKGEMDAEIDVKINNPNHFGFTIYKSELLVKLNSNSVGKAHLKKNIHISANSEQTYTFKINGKTDNLFSGGLMGLISIATSKNANIELSGNIYAGKFFYRKKIPIESTQRVPVFK